MACIVLILVETQPPSDTGIPIFYFCSILTSKNFTHKSFQNKRAGVKGGGGREKIGILREG